NTPKKKSVVDQYILLKLTPKTAKPTGPSSQPKDEGINMTNSETESNEIVKLVNKEKDTSNRELTENNAGFQDEGQAGSNPEKPHEEEPEKTNAESEVQSIVTVPIHQDISSVPLMTTLVIDLTTSQSESPTVYAPLPTSTTTTTTTTTTTLPPPQP
nr:hypothetical protein [Tanacetum cinerariifolium]